MDTLGKDMIMRRVFWTAVTCWFSCLGAPLSSLGTRDELRAEDGSKRVERAPEKIPDVVYIPTPQDVVERMLKIAKVTKSDVVYDLGCGDGRIVVTAAKEYGARSFGFELDPKYVQESIENARKNKVDHLVTIREKDIFKQDLSKATVVTLYLLPELNVRLIPQLEKLKPGSRIVSHAFDMKGVKPDKVVRMRSKEDGSGHTIYMWTAPLKMVPVTPAPTRKK